VAALLVLSAMPLAGGAFRLTQLAGGAGITPANARFFASPLPVVVHIVGAAVYALVGAFQFANGFRRRWPSWHRVAGRLLVVCGLLVGLSGPWMTLFSPWPKGLCFTHIFLRGFPRPSLERLLLGRAQATSHLDAGLRCFSQHVGKSQA
jgi:hypothetical protein